MAPFFPNAGAGPKITMKFRAKVFSFADVVVSGSVLTLYQVTEPLQTGTLDNQGTFANCSSEFREVFTSDSTCGLLQ
jgi:hypothetical protein